MGAKKKALLFGSNQHMIQLANGLQLCFQLLEVLEPLLDLRFHLRADAVLLGDAGLVTDRQHPGWVTSATRTLRTTRFVPNQAVDQRTAQDLGGGREVCD